MHTIVTVKPKPGALRALVRQQSGSCWGHPSVSTIPGHTTLKKRAANTFNFKDHHIVYEHQSTDELLRSLLVLQLCSFSPFAENSTWLLRRKDMRGESLNVNTPATVSLTPPQWLQEAVYGHFCAGQRAAEVWARMNALRAHGVGTILDIAETNAPEQNAAVLSYEQRDYSSDPDGDMKAEAECDNRLEALLASIDTAAVMPGTGFAAVQLAVLSSPGLLEHLSNTFRNVHAILDRTDGGVDVDPGNVIEDQLPALPSVESSTNCHTFDYVKWYRQVKLCPISALAEELQRLSAEGVYECHAERSSLAFTSSLRSNLEALEGRLERVVGRAVEKGVKLLFEDGEGGDPHGLRLTLEHLVHGLMRKHNRASSGSTGAGEAAVFLSYSTAAPGGNLADLPRRLREDLLRAEREGYTLGVKLVDDAHAYDDAYGDCLELLLGAVRSERAELMVGSHSPAGVEATVEAMSRLGLDRDQAPVYFQQRLGMADPLSFTLGAQGYKVYKSCPVGELDNVMPYVVRRIQDMRVALQEGGHLDLRLVKAELRRRLLQEPVLELLTGAAALFHSSNPLAAVGPAGRH